VPRHLFIPAIRRFLKSVKFTKNAVIKNVLTLLRALYDKRRSRGNGSYQCSSMKKQNNPAIKAHLSRSSFYVLLLLAVCVIPFALAQRNTTRQAATKPKVAADTRVGAAVATSQLRNDASARTARAKVNAPSYRFSHGNKTTARTPSGVAACFYSFNVGADAFVPGIDDIGNHTDDGDTFIALPFSVTLYGQSFTQAAAGSNGHLTFGTDDSNFEITCPPPFGVAGTTEVLAPYWGDQRTDDNPGCASFPGGTCGIFTTTTGITPNRIFYVEWRTVYFGSDSDTLNYEVALFENGSPPFEFIYNTISAASAGNDSQLVVGQKEDENCFTEFGCDTTGGTAPPVNGGQSLTAIPAGTPTPTPTPACTPFAFEGSIDASDPTQTDRMFRDGVPSTCDAPRTCPGPFGDGLQHHYDSYTVTNTTGATQCVSVDASTNCVDANDIFLVAYLGSFDPTDICANYVADQGSSPDPSAPPGPFSFDLADGQTAVIVVSEVTADSGCPDYTVTISNLCNRPSPTPRPRPTPFPRPTPP
jgi:hypothetical protein